MSVVIETTLGDITVDLYLDQRPVTCLNFLKLCKMKYYNYNLFHSIRSSFIAQTGDPTGEGSGGMSIFGILEGPDKRLFSGEKMPKIRHTDAGLLSMVCTGDMMIGSQFFFTLAPDLDSLDGIHCVIGEVTEGHDVLRKLNDVICDETHRPYRDVRITHTVVLEDPFNDPPGLRAPSRSPSPTAERLKGGRIAPDEEIDETQGKSTAEVQEIIEEKEAKARATILEIIGDIPDADIAPPENVLFVCKLNPVTTDDDLEIIFSRFGKIVSCEVIRDKKSGDSLQYAFIEFADKKSCEDAYFKMDNVLIDDRRIHVDFSQSVSKIKWLGKGRGVKLINESEEEEGSKNKSRYTSRERDHRNGRDYNLKRENYEQERNERERSKRNKNEKNIDKHGHVQNLAARDHRKHTSHKDTQRKDSDRYDKDIPKEDKRHKEHSERKDNVTESKRLKEHEVCSKTENHKIKHREASRKHQDRHNSEYAENDEKEKRNSIKHRDYHTKECSHDNVNSKNNEKNYNVTQKHKEHTKHSQKYMVDKSTEKKLSRKDDKSKLKRKYDKSPKREHKKRDSSCDLEPKTPSPVTNKKSRSEKRKKQTKKRQHKKRKQSTSSSSESDSSETSSSSTESSSSSEDNRKRKSKKRKRSSSSSSTSSSSDSSSSSSSSSSTSSSDSEADRKKRRKKAIKKKSR